MIQTDLKVDFIDTVIRKESFKDLTALRQQTSRFSPDYDRIKAIEDSVQAVDERLLKSAEDSIRLQATVKKLDSLSGKARELDEEINRIRLIEKSVDAADAKLSKAIQETKNLDETIVKLESINQRMDQIEPELSKIKTIEITLNKFDEKQNLLINLLMETLNKKPEDKFVKEEASQRVHEERPVQTPDPNPYSSLIDSAEENESSNDADRKLIYRVKHL